MVEQLKVLQQQLAEMQEKLSAMQALPPLLPRSDMTWAEAERLLLSEMPSASPCIELRRDLYHGSTKFRVFSHANRNTDLFESCSLAGAVNAALAAHRAATAAPDNIPLDDVMASAFEAAPAT